VTALVWRFLFDGAGPVNALLLDLSVLDRPIVWSAHSVAAWVPLILADVWKTTPFVALLVLAGLQSIDPVLHEAARMDGAGAWRRFRQVTLPLLRPALLVALIFRTLDAFRVFDNIFVLTAGANDTSSVSMIAYNNLIRGLNLGIGSTMSVLIFLAVAIIAFLFVKLFGTAAPGSAEEGGRR